MPSRTPLGTTATLPVPARPPTKPAGRPSSSLSKCAISGTRLVGSPSAFPTASCNDVEGLVKLVNRAEIAANDWSLSPGRYVGVAPEAEDEGFDFAEALRNIHAELDDLNAEAVALAATIQKNFERLGV